MVMYILDKSRLFMNIIYDKMKLVLIVFVEGTKRMRLRARLSDLLDLSKSVLSLGLIMGIMAFFYTVITNKLEVEAVDTTTRLASTGMDVTTSLILAIGIIAIMSVVAVVAKKGLN